LATSRHAVVALTYYSPYVSGLTEYARRVAEGLVRRGWRVTVVAAAHESHLPERETIAGVGVIRTPVIVHFGKGVVSPGFAPAVLRAARTADVVHIHMPMLEAAAVAGLTRSVPLVSTYHCDVNLPNGLLNSLQVRAIDASSRVALRRSQRIGVTTLDYARSSRVAAAMGSRAQEVGAPCRDQSGGLPRFRNGSGLHVGFLGRLVEEKGIEYLVDGFRALPDGDARLLVAGDYENVAGGSVVDRVRQRIGGDDRVRLLGFVAEPDLPDFYASIDVLVLPSINSLEAFGIVQVEALLLGIPVIVSDIPGVRIPPRRVGAGRVIPPRDAGAITHALAELARRPGDRTGIAERASRLYGLESVIEAYDRLLDESIRRAASSRRPLDCADHEPRHDSAMTEVGTTGPARRRPIDQLQTTWDAHGRHDPLWAILAEPGKRGGRWDVSEFFATGRSDVAQLMARLRELGVEPRGRALDFGCGVGRLTEALAEYYEEVDGVDVSNSMVTAARQHTTHPGVAHYHVNVAEDLALFESGIFDLVHSRIVLQHVGRSLARAYVQEFVRVLRPGGILHFQLPTAPRWNLAGVVLRSVPQPLMNRVRKMRMEGLSENRVRELIAVLGLELLDVGADTAAGPRWNSRHYTARKPS